LLAGDVSFYQGADAVAVRCAQEESMSEPSAIAQRIQEVIPGVWRWCVQDDRIHSESDAHAVVEAGSATLIDPLPLAEKALRRLEPIAAICLTAKCHQRSAWRYRKQFSVKVYAPAGVRPMEEEADVWYRAGDRLPGGLHAIHTPGPEEVHYGFLLTREPGVFFCPDLLMHGKGKVEFVPPEFHVDHAATQASVRRLLDLRFSVLCFNHGTPITDNPQAVLRELLQRTGT
jgi:glyoxylase-like metal-dependent hydrolase (beta-lactamase superfamily II)